MQAKRSISTIRAGFLAVLLAALFLTPGDRAAVPGLPFIEDFVDAALRDDAQTFANWSTDEQALLLAPRARRFGVFGPSLAGVNVTSAANQTFSVALGDVDGDGDLDLVAGNRNEANRLYLNNGTSDPWNGVSGVAITSDTGATFSMALGDVDRDGDLDLVAGNQSQANRLYLNNGTSDPWNGVSGIDITSDTDATQSVALGDVDGDGDLDLVAGNTLGQANRLYLNNGTSDPWDGVSGVNITSDAGGTSSVALGDVDGDGDLDLVAANQNQANRLYLSNGTPDPWNGVSGIDITTDAGNTYSVALGDVDGDGDLDLVGANNNQVNRLYLNNGTADPWDGVSGVDITGTEFSNSAPLGDLDGDGDLDLVVGNNTQINRLYFNNGTSDPWNGVSGVNVTSDVGNTRSVAVGDVDGDGDLDLVAGNQSQANRLYLNNATSDPWNGVSGVDATSDTGNTHSVALGDVDADGDLDLVAGNNNQANRLYLNNGTSDPWNGVSGVDITADTDFTESVVLGDVDGDGDLDLVVGSQGQTTRLYLNNGTSDPWNGVSGVDINLETDLTWSVVLGDVDGDGDLDLVEGNYFGTNRLYLNNGTPDPWNGVSGVAITSDTDATTSAVLGDVDGDGDLDLVTGNDPEANRLYLNNGTSDPWNGVSGVDITSDTGTTRSVALGDVDGDGDLDLVTGSQFASQTIRLYLNNGTSDPWNGVSGDDVTTDSDSNFSVALGDVDGDGDLDLLAGNNNNQANRLYLNNGTSDPWNGVSGIDLTSDTNLTWSVVLGDVDGDGDLDLVAGNQDQTNRVYLNSGTSAGWNATISSRVTADSDLTRSVAVGDVDGDGDPDVVVGNSNQANRLYQNNGTSDPWDEVTGVDVTVDADSTRSVALGDVDGDGDLDLVAGNRGQANRWYQNDGTSDPWNGVTGVGITADADPTRSIALGDVDSDGDLDLIAGNEQANRLYLNNGTSDPWNGVSGASITSDTNITISVALGDVDGDGDLDLVAGNQNQFNRLYLNNGTSDPWNGVVGVNITTDSDATQDVVLEDVDGDGDLDLVAGNNNQANRLYLNNGTSDPWNGVTGVDITTDSDATQAVVLDDVDRDGDLDLIAGNFGQANRLYLSNGTSDPWNGVTGVDITADADETYSVNLEDLDGDGELDLVAGNRGQPNRYYSRNLYDTARRRATSLRVDAEVESITNATLTPLVSLPANTGVEYWLSNDGGTRWYRTLPGVPFVFRNPGLDLRWRAELRSLSPVLTPVIDQIQITSVFQPFRIGDRVWGDFDGDGIQDDGEPGLDSVTVALYDGSGVLLDLDVTDTNGDYRFDSVTWGNSFSLRFFTPSGYTFSQQDQGGDDALDSDVDPVTGETPVFTMAGIMNNHTRWDAGMIPPCISPDEPIYISDMRLSTDGNDYPILDFQDPNQTAQISGYNVYRNSDPAPLPSTWPLVASDVIDMDEATPNKQWVDTSGDVSPTGTWYYQVTAFNGRCAAGSDEGPF